MLLGFPLQSWLSVLTGVGFLAQSGEAAAQVVSKFVPVSPVASTPTPIVPNPPAVPATTLISFSTNEPLPKAPEPLPTPKRDSFASNGSSVPASAPLYRSERTPMPIDLVTALRLVNASNPMVAAAQARYREALARVDQAQVLLLPDLSFGASYYRHDGQTQNQRGEVFTVSRSNLFLGAGPQLRVELSNALFAPLVARQLSQAEAARVQAISNDIQLDVALTYLELVQAHALMAINRDILAKSEQILKSAEGGAETGLSKTAADVNRAATEVNLRRQEGIVLKARVAAVSARLARLLLLEPTVDLYPADSVVAPVTLVSSKWSLEDLVQLGYQSRPELAANRFALDAAETRVRQAKVAPLVPRVQFDYLGGGFGGGMNDKVANFDWRGDMNLQAYWDLKNLGFGNRAQIRERRAVADQTVYRLLEVQAQVAAEITEAAKTASARYESLAPSQEAVKQAGEMYRKLQESSFQMIGSGGKGQFDALEPITAVQALNQARVQYLTQVIEFNRAQFRLHAALGRPAECALPESSPVPLEIPPVPGSEPEKKALPKETSR